MQLGVKISDEDVLVLKKTLPRARMNDEAKEQMRVGLEGYKNDGEAWDFKSPGLHETMASVVAASKGTNGKGELFYDLGVFIHADVYVRKATLVSTSCKTTRRCQRRCRKMER